MAQEFGGMTEQEFARQCEQAGDAILATLFSFPKPIPAIVMPGILAAVIRTLGISRDTAVRMLDAALEDIDKGVP
jgi:hypothetical protein